MKKTVSEKIELSHAIDKEIKNLQQKNATPGIPGWARQLKPILDTQTEENNYWFIFTVR